MSKMLLTMCAAILIAGPSIAQGAQFIPTAADCEQIRQAVATYGYATVKRYALTHYSKAAVTSGQRCLAGKHKFEE